jgi:hypothetical protein
MAVQPEPPDIFILIFQGADFRVLAQQVQKIKKPAGK